MDDIDKSLAGFSRSKLISDPTSLDRLDRLSDHLELDLWIKRDDLTGLGFGGNKIRQLEYYFGAALEQAADTILITGAVQSNYVRAAAAVAAKLGMRSVLQLESRVPEMDATYENSGNVLLAKLLGAKHIYYPKGEDEVGADKALCTYAEALRKGGQTPYVIPLGLDNPPLGALGYMRAAQEILHQGTNFDAIIVASGSGMTHAGLLTGLRMLGSNIPVYGICVRRNAEAQRLRLATILKNLAKLIGISKIVKSSDILVCDFALTPGYGLLGQPAYSALDMMAKMEGLFLDPVYTAKSFAGTLGLIEDGTLITGQRVLFVHTGGQPALFAYQDKIVSR